MRTKETPNFRRLDPGRPEIAILMEAMLRAREVVASTSWSTAHAPIPLPTLLDQLAAPGCSKIKSQWERCGIYYINPIDRRERKSTITCCAIAGLQACE
jgi:hypothetical protein